MEKVNMRKIQQKELSFELLNFEVVVYGLISEKEKENVYALVRNKNVREKTCWVILGQVHETSQLTRKTNNNLYFITKAK